jgi:hypothetical protein
MGLDRNGPVVGICRLCGHTKKLTFEHVPPRGAFNDFARVYPPIDEVIANETQGTPLSGAGTPEPRGAGAYTLCGDCNSRCGRYARHFIEWAIGWRLAMDAQQNSPVVKLTQRIWRARVMKQIMAMFLSVNPPGFGELNPEVRRYVWNAEITGLPSRFRLYAALTNTLDARQAAITGHINRGDVAHYSEIAFAPVILLMTFDSKPPDSRLVDITSFASATYKSKQDTYLELPVLGFRSFLPGIYDK